MGMGIESLYNSSWLLLCVAVVAVSTLTITAILMVLVTDLHRFFQEATRTFVATRTFISHAQHTAHEVQEVVVKGCDMASGIMDSFSRLGGRTQAFFKSRFGNGARGNSRRRVRSIRINGMPK